MRLTWSGATSTDIDVYRDGMVIVTTPNDGSYTDSTGDTGRARYTYRVCEAGHDDLFERSDGDVPAIGEHRTGMPLISLGVECGLGGEFRDRYTASGCNSPE